MPGPDLVISKINERLDKIEQRLDMLQAQLDRLQRQTDDYGYAAALSRSRGQGS